MSQESIVALWGHLEESPRPVGAKVTMLRLHFPTGEHDEAFAQKMETHIVQNRTTLKEIGVYTCSDDSDDARAVNSRYLDAVIRGLVQSTQNGRDDMALEKLEVLARAPIPMDSDQLSKILWAAPKKLWLYMDIMLREDESQSSFANDADWSSCRLEDLDGYKFNNDKALRAFLEMIAKMSSLEKIALSRRGENRNENIDSATVTPSLVKMMENNPNLRRLRLCHLLPEKRLFCQQVGKSKALKELFFWGQRNVEDNYVETLVHTLKKNPHVPLERFETFSSGIDHGTWGQSFIKYHMALNLAGRQKARDTSLSGEVLVSLLSRYCQQSAEANPIKSARTETEQQLIDACMLYGLLRESPGIWSAMAIHPLEDMDMKPAAKPSKRDVAQAERKAKENSKLE